MPGEIDIDLDDAFAKDSAKEVRQAKKMAISSGAPELVRPEDETIEKQFNIGKLPLSVIKSIDEKALDNRMNRKTFILMALKEQGVEIQEYLLRDRRRA